MRPDVKASLDKLLAEKTNEDKAVTHTQKELESTAKFLLYWAKRSVISKWGDGSVMYTKGKTSMATKIYPQMVEDLLKQGFATGTVQSFVMNAAKVKELK